MTEVTIVGAGLAGSEAALQLAARGHRVRLLEQKQAWVQVDQELFHLLGTHAAAALLAAHLYSKENDLLSALAGLGEQLK